MLGAAAKLSRCPCESASSTAQRIPCACSSISLTRVSRISPSGAPFDMGFRGLSNRVPPVVVLEQHLDERAALEVTPPEPFSENIENGKQPLGGPARAAFHLSLQPGTRPQLLAAAQER